MSAYLILYKVISSFVRLKYFLINMVFISTGIRIGMIRMTLEINTVAIPPEIPLPGNLTLGLLTK